MEKIKKITLIGLVNIEAIILIGFIYITITKVL